MKLTYKERQKAMTAFRKDFTLDVYTICRDGKPYAMVTRSNQVLEWRD